MHPWNEKSAREKTGAEKPASSLKLYPNQDFFGLCNMGILGYSENGRSEYSMGVYLHIFFENCLFTAYILQVI